MACHARAVLWIVGAGGLGREVADACRAAGTPVEGFVDDRAGGPVAGLPVVRTPPAGAELLVAVGDPTTRERLVERLLVGAPAGAVVHPSATLAGGVEVGAGVVVLAGAVVSVDAVLGPHAQVHYGATVGHDTRLGRSATVLPGAHVAGSVHLGDGVLVGTGAVVLQGLEIGARAVVGAGAVVTRDVAPGATVVGVPARPR